MAQSIQSFTESRRPRWKRLETLIQGLERRKYKNIEASMLKDLGRLYREATADLARLQAFRERGAHPEDLESYLNQLVGRAYAQIYRNPAAKWSGLWGFLHVVFPETFRKTAPWTLIAFGIFVLGFAYGFVISLNDEAFISLIVSPHIIQQVEEGKVWFDSILGVQPLASSMIMTNNISVSFLAFAFGMTFGLGTTYLMAFNGLMVGTIAALCHIHGLDIPFWSFVLPHGVIELTSIFIAGGSGLLLGTGLLLPGDLPRKDALIRQGRRAGRLILGCIPLLVVAGVIEGFFSPAPIPTPLKFAMAGVLFALLLCYLLLIGKKASPSASSLSPPGPLH